MSQSDRLLSLVEVFPQVFADPEEQRSLPIPAASRPAALTNQSLLQWIDQFPEVFADPDAPVEAEVPETAPVAAEPKVTAEPNGATSTSDTSVPAGYNLALQRSISTFTWGQIDCYLAYGSTGLERFWITAGKSGTEVQSLCEAICRLVNLLLGQQVSTTAIVKELRGIRGADAEGLGPHRVLGLADLIGKVLQEAPSQGAVLPSAGTQAPAQPPAATTLASEATKVVTPTISTAPATAQLESEPAFVWSEILNDHQASLCPECGAELQQINGCSGGACQVCGYSSCS